MAYRCEAVSLEGFIQQLAVCYVGRGYCSYVSGTVPPDKDPRTVDAKLIRQYGIDLPKWTRARRRRNRGIAGIQLLRHERFFVMLATEGKHRFFEEERSIRDVRQTPIVYRGYSVGLRGGRVHVRISDEFYKNLRAHFLDIALRRTADEIAAEFYTVPFEPWGPVKTQMFSLLGVVNDARRRASLSRVPKSAIWLKRRYVRPFDPGKPARHRTDNSSL